MPVQTSKPRPAAAKATDPAPAKTKAPAKPKAEPKPPAPGVAKGRKFLAKELPTEGTVQFRQGGDYKEHVRALGTFAKGNPTLQGHVKALVHLGWIKQGGTNAAGKSTAFTQADNAGLPEACWKVGEPAGPQIAANITALAEAGAPGVAIEGLWAAYTGSSVL